ncbi:Maf family protein [Dyella caseinilytica]|uniref:7-methyl-GTP pyrophosphatase n=1 Tax=Dyella caseinilytica TaxID=1849581 RepID=A0ABX7GYK4_9GAMM|nr:nucleoside triphosphate pyrophosphatase [Dyella caseinilytica]QRN55051.1 septum formation protein Maf [Dyella caseinilytica]GFZ99045.1 Maf-like protein [Dyella caseinilytica]
MTARRLILGSTSRYRAELLQRLGLPFEARSPGTIEDERPDEAPAKRAMRLAVAKATDAGAGLTDVLIIGSDQVAELDGVLLEKPGSAERVHAQLAACSGHAVNFHTALCLLDTRDGTQRTHLDLTRVHFRHLNAAEITRYIEREQPLDCAGSFKCEGLGISLFERIENSDPTALIGLPMIALAQLLRDTGISVP